MVSKQGRLQGNPGQGRMDTRGEGFTEPGAGQGCRAWRWEWASTQTLRLGGSCHSAEEANFTVPFFPHSPLHTAPTLLSLFWNCLGPPSSSSSLSSEGAQCLLGE